MSFSDTVIGLLQGTGQNGEWVRLERIASYDCRRGYYSNAPQALLQEHVGWSLSLDKDGVYAEFPRMDAPGVGVNFINAHCTFGYDTEGEATLVKVRRGTGVVQFIGGRVEHLKRLFDYDALHGQTFNNNMDLVVRGMEFTVFGGSDHSFVLGVDNNAPDADDGTQYGLYVEDCTFSSVLGQESDSIADLYFVSLPGDRVRSVFEKCRFYAVRSLKMQGFRTEFVRCYKSDFVSVGAQDSYLRQFNQDAGTPGNRTQSVRTAWQDTPWVQTGPRFNALKNADLKGQQRSTSASDFESLSVTGWSIAGGSDGKLVFGKWGDFSEANVSPSPETFYLKLRTGQTLSSVLDFINLHDTGTKVVTYQCLCKVSGPVTFSLVNSGDDTIVYDEVTLGQAGAQSDTTLITLRALVLAQEASATHAQLNVTNAGASDCQIVVVWQQAWGGRDGDSTYPLVGGLANATHVRTPGGAVVQNTYPWALNALSVKAAGRFQLPLLDTASGGDAAGMGWRSDSSHDSLADLQDGEVYADSNLTSVIGRADSKWYQYVQPDRVELNPGSITWDATHAKNIVCDDNSSPTITLSADTSKVPRGTLVRVFDLNTGIATVTVKVGTSTVTALTNNKMCELLFYVDVSGNGKWLVVQKDLATARF